MTHSAPYGAPDTVSWAASMAAPGDPGRERGKSNDITSVSCLGSTWKAPSSGLESTPRGTSLRNVTGTASPPYSRSARCKLSGMGKTMVGRVCEQCGAPFEVAVTVTRRPGSGRFCSRRCRAQSQIGKPGPTAGMKFRVTHEVRACEYCGALFRLELSRLKRHPEQGRFCTITCCNKSRAGAPSPMKGKKRSEAFREKCRVAVRPPPPPVSAETRAKRRAGLLGVKRDDAFREAARRATVKRHADGVYSRTADTAPERALATLLDRVGVAYERQVPIMWWVADFLVPRLALVVEADGDYWHVNPAKYPDGPKNALQAATIRRDRKRDAALTTRGFTVLHFWEADLLGDPDACEARLRAAIEAAQHRATPSPTPSRRLGT